MEVILLHDIERVGHEGDILKVSDGYARNYLFPRKLAEKCTSAARAALEQRGRAIERRQAEKRDAARTVAERIAGNGVTIRAAVGEGGRLHGQVTTQHLADALEAQLGAKVDRRDIEVPSPIREVGEFTISARLYKDVKVELPVHVVDAAAPEGTTEAAAVAAVPEPAAKAAPVVAAEEPAAEAEAAG
jgi:large subunit ribosomal protein L9